MKKFTVLMLMVLSVGLFATDISMKTEGSFGALLKNTDTNTWGPGKIRNTIKYGDANNSVTLINKWDASIGAKPIDLDYIWVDSKVGKGNLRVGLQRLGIWNSQPGLSETSEYLTETLVKDYGISYTTSEFTGFPVKVLHVKNIFFLDEAAPAGDGLSELAVSVQPMKEMQAGFIYSSDTSAVNLSGLSVFVDYKMSMSGINLLAQAYMNLSDDAATVRAKGNAKAAQLVHICVNTKLAELGTTLYGSIFTDLNSDNHAGSLKSELTIGANQPLNDKVFAVLEYQDTESAGTKSNSVHAGIGFNI
jgi:hypothetical protein